MKRVSLSLAGVVTVLAVGLPRGQRAEAPPVATIASVGEGIQFFQARWTADPRDYVAGRQLVRRLVTRFGLSADLGDLTLAEQAARSLVPVAPDPAGSWSTLSSVLLMQHKFGPALEAARRAVAAAPDDAEAAGALADALLAAGDYAGSRRMLQRLPGGTVSSLARWAALLDLEGRSDEAAVLMERACLGLDRARAPSATRAWCVTQWAGMLHAVHGPGAARAGYRDALRIQPGYRGALEGLAVLALAQGKGAEAARLYRTIATDAHPDLYVRLAELATLRGDRAQARAWYARFGSAALAPGREALYGPAIAHYYLAHGAVDSAVAVSRREVERRPTVESWDLLSWALYRAGRFEAAERAADRAWGWGRPSATMRYHRGRILEALGDPAGASMISQALEDWQLLEPHVRLEVGASRLGRSSGPAE